MKKNILLLTGVLFFVGCSSKEVHIKDIVDNTKQNEEKVVLTPYQMKITPIVGSHQNDSKVIVDTGVVLKIWIAPYKIKNTLIAGHDVYTWARKPNFIVGEDMPKYNSKQTSLITANGQFPNLFKQQDINNYKELQDKTVKKYVNNIYKVKAGDSKYLNKKTKEEMKQNSAILEYLRRKNGER